MRGSCVIKRYHLDNKLFYQVGSNQGIEVIRKEVMDRDENIFGTCCYSEKGRH